ncbi:MAG TPA: HEAT repeat domain-containing protein [Dongiaceae bacterium]|nr:HEAT repeat domain-containing protein [Dongiaceae bacterium]
MRRLPVPEPMRRYGLFLVPLFAASLVLSTRASTDEPDEENVAPEVEAEPPADPCTSPESPAVVLLACLRTGTWEQRVAAVPWLPLALRLVGPDTEVDPGTLDETIDLLIRIVHEEPDDWISLQVLEALEHEDFPGIDRLFRSALREPSINLKARAVERLALSHDPESLEDLEDLWRSEVPAWVRPRLIDSLSRQPLDEPVRSSHVEEFVGLSDDPDPAIRLAAIRALGALGDAAGRPALLRAARGGKPSERVAALEALASLPADDETMTELAAAVRSDNEGLRREAIRFVARLEHPDRDALLLEVLGRSDDDRSLVAAIEGLERSARPDVTMALAGLLDRFDLSEHFWIEQAILATLVNRDEMAGLNILMRLRPAGAGVLRERVDFAVAYLSRDRSVDERNIHFSTGGHLSVAGAEEEDPGARRIAATGGRRSIRCWAAPGVAGESWERDRPATGGLATIVNYFERPEGTWAGVLVASDYCWVPLADLVPMDTPPAVPDPIRKPRFEFDLPAGEAWSAQARALVDSGVMEILEPDNESDAVAAALTVDPDDPDQVALLQAGSAGRRGVLDRAIARFRSACCGPLP